MKLLKALALAGALAIAACAQNAALMPLPKVQFLDGNGVPLAGGLLYTCVAGASCAPSFAGDPPLNPLATYTDATAGTANPNPIILDSAGRAGVWLGAGSYKLVLQDATGAAVWTQDGVTSIVALSAALNASSGSTLIKYLASGAGAVSRTLAAKLGDVVSVKDYGAKCDGTTDDTTAVTNALASGAGEVYFPGRGTCVVGSLGSITTATKINFGLAKIQVKTNGTWLRIAPATLDPKNDQYLLRGGFFTVAPGYTPSILIQLDALNVTLEGLNVSQGTYATAVIVNNVGYGNTLYKCTFNSITVPSVVLLRYGTSAPSTWTVNFALRSVNFAAVIGTCVKTEGGSLTVDDTIFDNTTVGAIEYNGTASNLLMLRAKNSWFENSGVFDLKFPTYTAPYFWKFESSGNVYQGSPSLSAGWLMQGQGYASSSGDLFVSRCIDAQNVEATYGITFTSIGETLNSLPASCSASWTGGQFTALTTAARSAVKIGGGSLGTNLGLAKGSWSTWTPTLTANGSMTVTAPTVTDAEYTQIGPLVFFKMNVTTIIGGTASNTVFLTLPVNRVGNQSFVASTIATSGGGVGNPGYSNINTATQIAVSPLNGANFALGSTQFWVSGFYRVQ